MFTLNALQKYVVLSLVVVFLAIYTTCNLSWITKPHNTPVATVESNVEASIAALATRNAQLSTRVAGIETREATLASSPTPVSVALPDLTGVGDTNPEPQVTVAATPDVSPTPNPTPPAPPTSESPAPTEAQTPAPLPPVVLPDYALPKPIMPFKGEGSEVYLVETTTWTHRHIVDWETFLHLGFEQSDLETRERFAGYPAGPPITRLLKGSGEQVYWMENGLRRHIPDMETLLQLGYRQEDISEVPDELLATRPLGEPLPSVLGTPAEAVPLLSQERVVLTYALRDRFGGGTHTSEIYTVYRDGTRPKRLSHTPDPTYLFGPTWSLDGRLIAFASTPDSNTGHTSIAVTSFNNWNPTLLTEANGASYPAWSPDGTRIAYWGITDMHGSIHVMDADGGNARRLADGVMPAWTPDGRIAFCAGISTDPESPMILTVMDADGQNRQPVDRAITVLDQHYHPWGQDVWVAGGDPCEPMKPSYP